MEKTVVKAFSLIEALARGAPSRGISELGRELGLTKSNVHRLLDTLQSLGHVTRSDNGTYALSFELWRIGMSVISRLDIKGIALPYLQKLAHETGVTARLTVFANDQGLRSEEHTYELPSLMRISYAVFRLKKNISNKKLHTKPLRSTLY